MSKEEQIRQFARQVSWVTAENVCYLLEGELGKNRKHHWETKLFYYLRKRKNPEKRMKRLHNVYKDIYANIDYKGDTKGAHNLDHDIKLRNCLGKYLHKYGFGWNEFLRIDQAADALLKLYNGNIYFEMDNGNMTEAKLVEKLKRNYTRDGAYRVIFFMAAKPDEKEESRLIKLFKISAQVLQGKKGRVLGACYTQFLKDGKVYNHRMEEIRL